MQLITQNTKLTDQLVEQERRADQELADLRKNVPINNIASTCPKHIILGYRGTDERVFFLPGSVS